MDGFLNKQVIYVKLLWDTSWLYQWMNSWMDELLDIQMISVANMHSVSNTQNRLIIRW